MNLKERTLLHNLGIVIALSFRLKQLSVPDGGEKLFPQKVQFITSRDLEASLNRGCLFLKNSEFLITDFVLVSMIPKVQAFFSLFMKRQESISTANLNVIAIPHVQLQNWQEENGRLFWLIAWKISFTFTVSREKFESIILSVQVPTKAMLSLPTTVLGHSTNVPFEIKVTCSCFLHKR